LRRNARTVAVIEMGQQMSPSDTQLPAANVPAWLRMVGQTLRVAFLITLAVLTCRVSLPQNETIATAYDTPNDLIRLALGFAVCVWLIIQLFRPPHDAAGYRAWFYVGLAGVPFALICLFAVW
jgi:TRAP-type C4-dicarboxylate transport system permease small subunit